MSHHPRLAYVLLAAGGASRFGSCKQLATIDYKQTILEHTLEMLQEVAPGEIELVLGAYKPDIEKELDIHDRYPRVNVLENKSWSSGIASSISRAIDQILKDHFDGVLITLADQISIRAEQLKEMRECWYQHPTKIIAAKYDGILGVPAIFPVQYFEQLGALTGDQGARALIEREKHNAQPFELQEAHWDIDTEIRLSDWQIENI